MVRWNVAITSAERGRKEFQKNSSLRELINVGFPVDDESADCVEDEDGLHLLNLDPEIFCMQLWTCSWEKSGRLLW